MGSEVIRGSNVTLKPWMKHSNSVFFILRTHRRAMKGSLSQKSGVKVGR